MALHAVNAFTEIASQATSGAYSTRFIAIEWIASLLPGLLQSGFGLFLLQRSGRLARHFIARTEHHCFTCDYDLREVTTDKCPECGSPIERASHTEMPQ